MAPNFEEEPSGGVGGGVIEVQKESGENIIQ